MKNRSPSHLNHSRLALAALLLAAASLAACSRNEDQTVGQKLDGAIASAEQKAQAAKADLQKESSEAKTELGKAADQMAAKAESTGEALKGAVSDASVTASIHAELARDPSLSTLKIDVDTSNGQVLLTGTAPSTAARDRATVLAQGVKGVVSVKNRLEVRG